MAWATDITYPRTLEGWLYLAAILDLFSRRVVGYAIDDRIDRRLLLQALDRAVTSRPGARDAIIHSDRGSQFASGDFRQALDDSKLILSMSRRGNCWDNAVVESFFGTLKTEPFLEAPVHCADVTEAIVVDYIDGFYNPVRRHSSIGYMSPIEYELREASPARVGSASAPRGGIKIPRQEGPAQAA